MNLDILLFGKEAVVYRAAQPAPIKAQEKGTGYLSGFMVHFVYLNSR